MNHIDIIRTEINKHIIENTFEKGILENFISPSKKFRIETIHNAFNYDILITTYSLLRNDINDYADSKMLVDDIDENWVRGLFDFMRAKKKSDGETPRYAPRTIKVYAGTLKVMIRRAMKDGLIASYPFGNLKLDGKAVREIVYLTIGEIKAMGEATCCDPELKRAFLFSCLTGLRYSDTINMEWGMISDMDGTMRVTFRQQKTSGIEYLDINEQAAEIVNDASGRISIFAPTTSSPDRTAVLRMWARAAGVNKNITYHSSRHTFAVMMLTLGADIYTVSRLLGHRSIRTTEIYADIIDKKKQDAVRMIPRII